MQPLESATRQLLQEIRDADHRGLGGLVVGPHELVIREPLQFRVRIGHAFPTLTPTWRKSPHTNRENPDAPGRIRTSDQQLRRLLLYPPELRAPDYLTTT